MINYITETYDGVAAAIAERDGAICAVALSLTSPEAAEAALRGQLRAERGGKVATSARATNSILRQAAHQLGEYFAGQRHDFYLPLDLSAGTPFQQAVWRACAEIGCGETRSYSWLSQRLGRPNASRAVGGALGANPLPVLIPCHRVLRSGGALGGYSGGLDVKRRLLALEHTYD